MKKSFLISFLLCAFLPPASVFSQEPVKLDAPGIISVPLANVHEEPRPKSALATQVLMADEVRVLEKRDYRYRIAIPDQDNREGWIQQEALFIPRDQGRRYLSIDRSWVVIASPKTEALILDRTGNHKVPIYAGTRFPVLEKTAEGLKVQFPDRSLAIVNPTDVMAVKPDDPLTNETTGEEIAKTARQFVGVRQLAGGLTDQGMDIKGLIYIVYRIHGFSFGTDRAAFKARAVQVQKNDLRPGDILVFHGGGEGLYVGNGRFLQAAKKKTIQLAGLHEKRYARALQYGLRVIGVDPDRAKTPAELTAGEILLAQARSSRLPLGKRIAYWAGRFIGTPYDPDPLGLYVRTNRIVADEKVDCMYLTFRSVELAESTTPGEAIAKALDLRFLTRGALADGIVTNYDQRFQYGEDMVLSGKWGRNITADLGAVKTIEGTRGKEEVEILPKNVLATKALQKKLRDGDIIYWVKDPKKRAADEIVAHLAIIHIKTGRPYLIHASGSKDRPGAPGGGVVKEVPFAEYVHSMGFIGAFVTRFEQ